MMIKKLLQITTGLISHDLCSTVFVSGLDPEQDFLQRERARPGMRWLDWALRHHVDMNKREVTASAFGLLRSRAIYRDGLGAILVRGPEPTDPPICQTDIADSESACPALPEIAGSDVVEPVDERLRAALDDAFAEPTRPPYRRTKAVIVVRDGRVVAERYAPGYGMATRLLGYSNAKSVINALIGILVRQGRLAVDKPAVVEEWSDPADPRHAIMIDHLLRMTSGLAIRETRSPLCGVARMIFLERDMASFAMKSGLRTTPGTCWRYTSGNTVVLSRIVRDAVGGRAIDVFRFAHRELFQPLGMRDVTIEFDATGTPVGSTYIFASARDWARFGLLYLHDGVVAGRQILPESWVRYSSTPTLGTGYGAGFWTNRIQGEVPGWNHPWAIPGAPEDAISARGSLGQFVIVIPSQRLVIARFGLSFAREDAEGVGRLVADVIAALAAAPS
jgi:CubicO group peptidase (beta-lactamase class C family)